MERPHLGKSRLQRGDEIGVGHHLVEKALLFLQGDLDPQVIDEKTAQRTERSAQHHHWWRAVFGFVGVAQAKSALTTHNGLDRLLTLRGLEANGNIVADLASPGTNVAEVLEREILARKH